MSSQTKEVVANYTADINLANAQAALMSAINSTLAAVQTAGSTLTSALIDAKMSISNVKILSSSYRYLVDLIDIKIQKNFILRLLPFPKPTSYL
jgi:hypothetical protein